MQYLLFDLETTCWESTYPKRTREIIEVGAILMDTYGKEIDRFECLVKPEIHPYLSQYCTRLTGITQEDVDSGIDFQAFHSAFNNWIHQIRGDFVFVAWGSYDHDILEDGCHNHRLESFLCAPYIDAKLAYHRIKRLNYKLGLKKALKHEGLEFEGQAHRAMPDTLNLARLFRKYIGEWPV